MDGKESTTGIRAVFSRLGLVIVVALAGLVVGSITAVFLQFLYRGIEFLWHELPALLSPAATLPYYTLLLALVGGLLVGLCQKYLGNYPKTLQESLVSFRETKRFEYGHVWQGALTAGVSLLFGASLGPEAALLDLTGGLSTWMSDRLRQIGLRSGVLDSSHPDQPWPRAWRWGLMIVALAAGALAFLSLSGDLFSGALFDASGYSFNAADMLYAVPVGLIGAAGGMLFNLLQVGLPRLVRPLKPYPVLLGLSGGLALGVLATYFPLILFSGQHEIGQLLEAPVVNVFWFLLFTGLAKFFVTSYLLASGWKGGQFLPVMFGGAAFGLALAALLPAMAPLVGLVAGMAGATVAVLKQPVAAAAIILFFVPLELFGVVAAATVAGYILLRAIPLPAQFPTLQEETPATSATD